MSRSRPEEGDGARRRQLTLTAPSASRTSGTLPASHFPMAMSGPPAIPLDGTSSLLPGPRHPLLRARQRSLPAEVVRSRHYSLVGSGSTIALRSADAEGRSAAQAKRFSLATFASGSSKDNTEQGLTSGSRPPTSPPLGDISKRNRQGRCAQTFYELVDTESRYLQVLEHIDQVCPARL